MGQARGNPELLLVGGGKLDTEPSTERRARRADVDCDIEDAALRDANEFALGVLALLVVEPAKDTLRGARMVVLHEREAGSGGLVEAALVEAFEEKATLVAENLRLQDEHPVDGGGRDDHDGYTLSLNTRCR